MKLLDRPLQDLTEITADGRLRFHFHPGQWRAWESTRRFVAVIAGTQSGKTAFGPAWLYREIQRCGAGDYLVVTPTFALLEKKALPELLKLFNRWLRLGTYTSSPVRKFVFSEDGAKRTFGSYDPDKPTTVFFGYAEDPESLESATAKAAWLDEAGQKKFKLGSWEAILRRLSLAQGRTLITTTPYDLGWLKQQIYNRFQADEADYDVIRFDSTENPAFPQEEFERAKRDLPRWKFDLFYRGIFTRPAGQIYDNFRDELQPAGHLCKRFPIPADWPRYVGLDFGGVHTAAGFYAEDPATRKREDTGKTDAEGKSVLSPPVVGSGKCYLYRTYLHGGRTAAQHAAAIRAGEPANLLCVGGSHSEDQWRDEFKAAGLPVLEPPIKDVEVGIDRVYAAHAADQIIVFDDLADYRAQKLSYSREMDANGNPTEKIEDKATYHLLDQERYIFSHLRGTPQRRQINIA